ncbi:DUF6511 domain-containing protein [Sagittula sp. S175]|uniref:DUF6511 domain-containing protein n=1 Tax=Sagittula sp. S175 TaxID=3415129 RepID=UPI003C7D5B26
MTCLPGYPCPICRRPGGWATINMTGAPLAGVCSPQCAEIWIKRKGQPNVEQFEREAVMAGGAKAGAYLDSIGKSDLGTMTREEWATFCETLWLETCDVLRKRADDDIPF